MLIDWRKKFGARFCFRFGCGAADADPRLDEWTNEPRPDGALMVNGIALARAALVVRCITRLAWRERAQTHGRKQKHLHRIDNTTCFVFRQQGERQSANSEDLVRSECKIDYAGLVIAIDDVSKITSLFVPELAFKRCTSLFEQ